MDHQWLGLKWVSLALAAAFVAYAASALKNDPAGALKAGISFPVDEVRSGDVIFRRGTSIGSRTVLWHDSEATFSHVGIVHRSESTETLVVHAAPGRRLDVEVPLQIEPIAAFLANSQSAAIYRLRAEALQGAAREAAEAALSFARSARFDPAFDLATDDRLYCTELVWRAYQQAGIELVSPELGRWVATPFGRRKILFPSALTTSTHLVDIQEEKDHVREMP